MPSQSTVAFFDAYKVKTQLSRTQYILLLNLVSTFFSTFLSRKTDHCTITGHQSTQHESLSLFLTVAAR